MHPLRYVVVINYTSFLNNECKAHIMGFYSEIEKAREAIYEDLDDRRKWAEENGYKANEGYNSLEIDFAKERFTYDIHDLCAEDWSCESRA